MVLDAESIHEYISTDADRRGSVSIINIGCHAALTATTRVTWKQHLTNVVEVSFFGSCVTASST